ncbi:MAG: helix-turn-helix transcriptional regulator [Clostridia bacterium]|nr:helix-turn-helix transcriptional regulator [Clostridia bacterium]
MDNFTRLGFEKNFNIEKIITIFYMEFPKNFYYEGERHDFWEMVYIDKGEMVCTADQNRFILKSGEMTFHKPNEFHNLSGDHQTAPNVSILTFECKSRAMKHFEGKIFHLDAEEKSLLSMLFEEGLSCYRLADERNPLLQKLERVEGAPFGSSQMTKNLLEIFLIKLCRNTDVVTKKMRRSYQIDGVDIPYDVKEVLDVLKGKVYDRISVKEVAKAVGKSESTVKQLFARYRKGGMMQYYNALKISEAKKLIREGKYNITQISDLLRFDNPQYFSKCFKKFTRMTPKEYKSSIIGEYKPAK